MNIQRWVARREPSWRELEALLQQAEKRGLKTLSTAQVKHLASLYRSVSADYARARTHAMGNTLTHNLHQLTSRAYGQIYQGSRRQEWQALVDFYRVGFPSIVQETWGYLALSTGLFILGGLIGWWFSWHDPTFMSLVAGEGFVKQVQSTRELWTVSILGVEPIASSTIMVNNLIVSFLATFGGVTMYLDHIPMITPPGTFTLYLLFSNGLLLGAIAVLVAQTNLAYPFWAFVFPHGSLELPAIFLAGAAGFLLARAILLPGSYRRRDALKIYGLKAAKLVYGVVPLLVIAGIIEGFYSPSPLIPDPIKYLTGIGLFLLLLYYCFRRLPKSEPDLLM